MARSKTASTKPIRVGVIGVGRGQSFAAGASEAVGMKLVALCDTWEERLTQTGKRFGVSTYTDFDKFLEHDMDAVILANYFHQHAPFAIKALKAGKHVMSETASNTTMAEGVELCRTVEKTGKTYMLAENYPYSAANQEMRKVYLKGKIGNVVYAEGEYNHAAEENWRLSISPGLKHWRNWLPSTYYCSHALAPLMYITNTMPVKVNSLAMTEVGTKSPHTVRVGDAGSVILCRMDNGAVFRIFGLMISSEHRVRYEVHGDKGLIGTAIGNAWGGIRVHQESWFRKKGDPASLTYSPDWPEHGDLAKKAGHGGGDFWTNFHFANAIRTGTPPYLDVYRGVAMCSVGILAWRSCLKDGAPLDMPDFRQESQRKKFANDHWSPWPDGSGDGKAPPSIKGYEKPNAKAIARARKVWKSIGFKGE
ncbi:MAG: Gfo/Idh/MocA family oxidoreductase [Planctomycetota bacterium]|nr:Gfo/Idh/MocA family oxidoreductase [Planctomycetota bacterium]